MSSSAATILTPVVESGSSRTINAQSGVRKRKVMILTSVDIYHFLGLGDKSRPQNRQICASALIVSAQWGHRLVSISGKSTGAGCSLSSSCRAFWLPGLIERTCSRHCRRRSSLSTTLVIHSQAASLPGSLPTTSLKSLRPVFLSPALMAVIARLSFSVDIPPVYHEPDRRVEPAPGTKGIERLQNAELQYIAILSGGLTTAGGGCTMIDVTATECTNERRGFLFPSLRPLQTNRFLGAERADQLERSLAVRADGCCDKYHLTNWPARFALVQKKRASRVLEHPGGPNSTHRRKPYVHR